MKNDSWCTKNSSLCTKSELFYVKDNFLTDKEFQNVLESINNKKKKLIKDSRADRLYMNLPNHKIVNLFKQKTQSLLNNIGIKTKLNISKLPLEYRIYKKNSRGMQWHKDSLIDKRPQFEIVFTLENESNSRTIGQMSNGKKIKVKTKPNQVIIVMGGGILHKVSPITNNKRRIILKLALLQG